jgi:hypothetical protein
MWRAACALISCGYTTLGRASSPDVISTNLNNINGLKFYHEIRGNVEKTISFVSRSTYIHCEWKRGSNLRTPGRLGEGASLHWL